MDIDQFNEFRQFVRQVDNETSPFSKGNTIRNFFQKSELGKVAASDKSFADEAVPALIRWLKDQDPSAREAAANFLGWFGGLAKEAIPALLEATKDPSRQYAVSGNAYRALKFIDPDQFNESHEDPKFW